MIGNLDQILCAGGFSNQHTVRVIFFQNIINLCDLAVHLVAGNRILRVDQKELVLIVFQKVGNRGGKDFLRYRRAYHGIEAQRIGDSVYLINLLYHSLSVLSLHFGVRKDHVGGADVKTILKLGVGDHIIQILR